MNKNNIFLTIILTTFGVLWADPPNWEDTPGAYEFTAVMNAQVFLDGIAIADEGDMLAAFDSEGNVRGTGIQIDPGFGPYDGQILYETMLRSNAGGDILTFQYYDASEDAVLDIQDTYEFIISDLAGTLVAPHLLNIDSNIEMANSNNLLPINYELTQNYPNPYNPRTNIHYTVAQLSNVTLKIYDIKGKLIAELLSEIHTPGKYETIWDSDYLATGMYLLDMKVYSINGHLIFKDINKMLYLK